MSNIPTKQPIILSGHEQREERARALVTLFVKFLNDHVDLLVQVRTDFLEKDKSQTIMECATFGEYCRNILHYSESHVRRLIAGRNPATALHDGSKQRRLRTSKTRDQQSTHAAFQEVRRRKGYRKAYPEECEGKTDDQVDALIQARYGTPTKFRKVRAGDSVERPKEPPSGGDSTSTTPLQVSPPTSGKSFDLRVHDDVKMNETDMMFAAMTADSVPLTIVRRSQYVAPTYKGSKQLYDVHFITLTEEEVHALLEKQSQPLFEEVFDKKELKKGRLYKIRTVAKSKKEAA